MDKPILSNPKPWLHQAPMKNLLIAFTEKAKELFGMNLMQVVLFGSYARGDFQRGSDVDILVVADFDEAYRSVFRKKVSDIAFDIGLAYDMLIQTVLVSVAELRKWGNVHELFRNIGKDGVNLYDCAG